MRRTQVLCVAAALTMSTSSGVAQEPPRPAEVRRVVTGLDTAGKAVVLFDSAVALNAARTPNAVGDLWMSDKSPADFSRTEDPAATPLGLTPPRSGSVFRVVDFPPISPAAEEMDVSAMTKVVGSDVPKRGLPPRHPMMHRTRSLDYAIILSGEIDMMLDETTVHLKAGDVVVQQATNHAWINRGTERCRVAFILIDSQEP